MDVSDSHRDIVRAAAKSQSRKHLLGCTSVLLALLNHEWRDLSIVIMITPGTTTD